jgi:hypothetical protein
MAVSSVTSYLSQIETIDILGNPEGFYVDDRRDHMPRGVPMTPDEYLDYLRRQTQRLEGWQQKLERFSPPRSRVTGDLKRRIRDLNRSCDIVRNETGILG